MRVGQRRDQRVQHQRAMRVDDALRPAGRARRVAHGRRAALVERRASRIGSASAISDS